MDYNFADTIKIWWHGKWQRVLWEIDKWVPYVHPEKEGDKAPSWWRDWYAAWTWAYYLDDNDRPTEHWLDLYDPAARDLFHTWFERLKATAVDESLYWVAGWTGKPKHGYYTLEDWINAIRTRVGTSVSSWAGTVSNGINILYAKLPANIRYGLASWADLWESIKDSVKTWAKERYDAWKVLAQAGWNWITAEGSLLSTWYTNVGAWVSTFRQDPAGTVISLLGETWTKLVTFTRDALTFYYNLWGSYRQTLADFLADPLGYLYDRVEQYLVDKW